MLDANGGPYFLGERFSLVDIMCRNRQVAIGGHRYTPFLERAVASLAYFKAWAMVRDPIAAQGYDIRERLAFPAINRWFDAMETSLGPGPRPFLCPGGRVIGRRSRITTPTATTCHHNWAAAKRSRMGRRCGGRWMATAGGSSTKWPAWPPCS